MSFLFFVFLGSITFLLLTSMLVKHQSKVISLSLYLLLATYFALVLASRNVYAIDDAVVYMSYFKEYSDFSSIFTGSYSWKGDYFFFFLGYLFKLFSKDPVLYIKTFYFVNTLCFFVLSATIISRCKTHNYLFNFVFIVVSSSFFFLYGNVIRQGLAFNLFLLFLLIYSSPRYYLKFIWLIIITILAFLSHKAIVVLFLPVLFIRFFSKFPKPKFIIVVLFIGVSVSNFMEILLYFLGGPLLSKFMIYKESVGEADGIEKLLLTFILLIITTYILQYRSVLKLDRCRERIQSSLYYCAVFNFGVVILTYPFGKIATRFLLYSDACLLLLLPILVLNSYEYKKNVCGIPFYAFSFFCCFLLIIYSFMFYQHDGIVSVLGQAVLPNLF